MQKCFLLSPAVVSLRLALSKEHFCKRVTFLNLKENYMFSPQSIGASPGWQTNARQSLASRTLQCSVFCRCMLAPHNLSVSVVVHFQLVNISQYKIVPYNPRLTVTILAYYLYMMQQGAACYQALCRKLLWQARSWTAPQSKQ